MFIRAGVFIKINMVTAHLTYDNTHCKPYHIVYLLQFVCLISGALVAQWVKRWPTDLADRVRSSIEVKSSQP